MLLVGAGKTTAEKRENDEMAGGGDATERGKEPKSRQADGLDTRERRDREGTDSEEAFHPLAQTLVAFKKK